MKKMVLLVVVAAVVSCGLEEIGSRPGAGDGIWIGPGSVVGGGSGTSEDREEVWYAVAVDYREGYDWRVDEEKGTVKCSLVVFANGIPMMKVPVGDEYEASADPDMHRMVNGALYSDFSTSEGTVIKRNGEEIFRYDRREIIVDMAVEGDYVYTLGQCREGDGFAFRRNGEVLLERPSGYPFPRIQRTEDGWSFAFYEPEKMSMRGKCFHYLAGEVCEVSLLKDVVTVWDAIYYKDKVCYVASVFGTSAPVLVVEKEKVVLETKSGQTVKSCRFLPCACHATHPDSGLYIEGVMSENGKDLFSALWKGARLQKTFQPGYIVASSYMSEDAVSCALNSSSSYSFGVIYHDGESFRMPLGYMSMGGRSMVMAGDKVCVGLTSSSGGKPAVWVNDDMKPLKINGFISHMSVY